MPICTFQLTNRTQQKKKSAQITLIDAMTLNSQLTGLELRIRQILLASDLNDIGSAVSRINRKLQLHHIETQKCSASRNVPISRKKSPTPNKQNFFWKRFGHLYNECISRQ